VLLEAICNSSVGAGSDSIRVTVSIGVSGLQAAASREFATVQSLMESADTSLYASKLRGRNCVTVADAKPSRVLAGMSTQQGGSHDDAKMSVNSLR
jgi:predicted signal transduction protein with EAL and GGDEF domain